jgi:hypothetical protein
MPVAAGGPDVGPGPFIAGRPARRKSKGSDMANEIKDKASASSALTITLASLATSTAGVGRQSTVVDNTTNAYESVLVYASIKLGSSPTANKSVQLYLIRDDNGTPIRSDIAGAADAAWTQKNAESIGSFSTGSSPSTGDVLSGAFLVPRPGPKWAVGVVHDSGANLDSTGGNHAITFVGLKPEVQ